MDDHDLKSQQQSHAPSDFLQDTPPRADVDEILRRKRKAREYKVSRPMCAIVESGCGAGDHLKRSETDTRERSVFGLPNWATQSGAQSALACE